MDKGYRKGSEELKAPLRRARSLFVLIALFSVFVNLLMMTGPLYMLQVYDRVLGSGSEATLLALTAVVAFLYFMMGILDYVRGRVMARIGAQFQEHLDARVFDADLKNVASLGKPATGVRDLEVIHRLISSPVLMAIFDLPWTPIFLAAIAIFHPWLGLLAVAGGVVLISLTLLNQLITRVVTSRQIGAVQQAGRLSGQFHGHSETVRALGMSKSARDRWMSLRDNGLAMHVSSTDRQAVFMSTSKVFRLFLQSAMLGLGAYLVLHGEMTAGAMIAGSILMGRALQPVEQIIGQWQVVQAAKHSWGSLCELLGNTSVQDERTPLPRPNGLLEIDGMVVAGPGQKKAGLRISKLKLEPGQALGVIGTSGSGKTTMARSLTGVWPIAGGKVRLGGANIEHYDPDVLGGLIGYLPQAVHLFDGTITDNIARLAQKPDVDGVIAAAKAASAHEMILGLPNGYDTKISAAAPSLSGGQIQRIGLARALYGDPVMLVLDEPNSNLDHEGSLALNVAIKNQKALGGIVVIMAHRPAAIQECDLLMVLDRGQVTALGPREDILKANTSNHKQTLSHGVSGDKR